MTVKELRNECDAIISQGYGNHNIAISRDDEGNGYHMLYYTFMTDKDDVKNVIEGTCSSMDVGDTDNLVLLG